MLEIPCLRAIWPAPRHERVAGGRAPREVRERACEDHPFCCEAIVRGRDAAVPVALVTRPLVVDWDEQHILQVAAGRCWGFVVGVVRLELPGHRRRWHVRRQRDRESRRAEAESGNRGQARATIARHAPRCSHTGV
jgi:hypothetical protein